MGNVRGFNKVKAALRKVEKRHAKGMERGVVKAGLHLQRKSQIIVPVEFAVLKNSANTRKEGSGFDVEVVVSYGTEYAVFVHEDLEAEHKPGKQAKFLEQPARDEAGAMADIIKKEIVR